MIDVHVGRIAARGRTLANPVLDHLLWKAKGDWLMAARAVRSELDVRLPYGAWPSSLAQYLQHWVTEMSEAEARINMLVMVDNEITSSGLVELPHRPQTSTKGR